MKRKEVMVMIRKIIHIDEKRCNGCGLCAAACHEGAIAMINGKAKLIKDDYCDGLGDCLPACPTGAIEIKEREAIPYNEEAVKENKKAHVCPGSMAKALNRNEYVREGKNVESALRNWPVQIKLAPFSAPYYKNADLLIAADCTAYSYDSFHDDFIAGKTVLIGCPKLDAVNYSDKLREIIKGNDIRSITIVKMEVPCCKGLEIALRRAIEESGKAIALSVITISISGEIVNE